jgi:uncharacterized membrane protein (UPF0127 family)
MIERRSIMRPALALLAAGLLSACAQESPPDRAEDGPSGLPRGVLIVQTDEGDVRIQVEIAETPIDRARGLMERGSLPQNAGMVFLEDEPAEGGFWMKDTLIPLSIAFWGRDGRIFQILDMEPCRSDDCPLYEPDGEWVGAAEVNQGFFEDHGVGIGDGVVLRR